jgi:HD superfamily phosphohydrolase
MEIRDPVHGSISILDVEKPIIEHLFFQRLRNIKQLGFSEFVFPGATHTRYLHSIGVMHVSTLVFNSLFKQSDLTKELQKLKETLRLACLLHDIGHAPLSHSTESVMPVVSALKLPARFVDDPLRQATHEDYTLKSIVDSSFTESFKLVTEEFGVTPVAVAELVIGKTWNEKYFNIDGINYFPILHQLVSSEMDCDRMDYLLRDSYFCGVSYGKFDLDWIIDNLKVCEKDQSYFLGISERAISTFDDFLLSRFHMFMMVYFHYRAVCLEKMLARYFSSSQNEYQIPADIEAYQEHDDPFLLKVLRKSSNVWAKRIIRNSIPQKILETFGNKEEYKIKEVEDFLIFHKIDFIKCSSQGRLSKYYTETHGGGQFAMKVVKESALTKTPIIIKSIHEATDLFDKYSHSHAVSRIHCDFHELSIDQQNQLKSLVGRI